MWRKQFLRASKSHDGEMATETVLVLKIRYSENSFRRALSRPSKKSFAATEKVNHIFPKMFHFPPWSFNQSTAD